MKKNIFLCSVMVLFFIGCGGGSDTKEVNDSNLSIVESGTLVSESNLSEAVKEETRNCTQIATFDYTYKYAKSNTGEYITVGDENYTIVAMPFFEYETGDHYYIKYPVPYIHYMTLDVSYEPNDTSCYTHSISNFPAMYDDTTEGAWYGANFGSSVSTLSISKVIFSGIYIKINKTVLHLNFFEYKDIQTNPIEQSMDARDSIDWEKLDINKKILLDDIKTLLNHIEIIKIVKDN